MLLKAPKADELPTDLFAQISELQFWMMVFPAEFGSLVIRFFVLSTYILSVAAGAAVCMVMYNYVPIILLIPLGLASFVFFLGVVFMTVIAFALHPRKETKLPSMSIVSAAWMQYLQALYLSQQYTLSMINGSWMAAWSHKILGADTPLDAQWYSSNIRDHMLLTVGHNAVIDRNAYLVGHSGQPDWTLGFRRSSVGDNAVVHSKAIMLDGMHLGKGATLDFYAHSHLDSYMAENKCYSGRPANPVPTSCYDALNAVLSKERQETAN
jgi:hypothetical protein